MAGQIGDLQPAVKARPEGCTSSSKAPPTKGSTTSPNSTTNWGLSVSLWETFLKPVDKGSQRFTKEACYLYLEQINNTFYEYPSIK